MILLIYFLKHNYKDWFKNEELDDTTRKSDKEESVDLSDIEPLECDRRKRRKRIKNRDSKQIVN